VSKRTKNTKRPVSLAVFRQLVPAKQHPRPDELLPALDIPLPHEISAHIARLRDQGMPRTQIAKTVGIPKVHVIQELIRLGG
jgi:hypothetical protein